MKVRSPKFTPLVIAAQAGDCEAFAAIVNQYQDMAVAYAYSILRDFHAAEDAAQEAFIEAYQTLASLQNPLAFSRWLRRIIFKHCDRQMRQRVVLATSLEGALEVPDNQSRPDEVAEQQEFRTEIRHLINSLPERERTVILLYFMGERTYQEIADFLEVPLSTVKKRLYSSRQRLRTQMIELTPQDLQAQKPSRDEAFATRVKDTAKRIASKYRPSANASPASGTMAEALASRLRKQSAGAKMTLETAGPRGEIWYGKPQDCLSVVGQYAHLARHNQILLLDIVATGALKVDLPETRPQTMEATWEFLLEREHDSLEQTVSRLTAVNEQLANFTEKLSYTDFDLVVETLLYERQTLRDLLLIILQQGSFAAGQAWGIIKLQAYDLLKDGSN